MPTSAIQHVGSQENESPTIADCRRCVARYVTLLRLSYDLKSAIDRRAMAAGGAPALHKALTIIEQEIRTSMALMGVNELAGLGPALLERAQPMVAPSVLSAFPLLDEGY